MKLWPKFIAYKNPLEANDKTTSYKQQLKLHDDDDGLRLVLYIMTIRREDEDGEKKNMYKKEIN